MYNDHMTACYPPYYTATYQGSKYGILIVSLPEDIVLSKCQLKVSANSVHK